MPDRMPAMTSLRLADLSDKELEDLHGNAIRLAQSGTGAQRAEAERLLPVIGREVEARAQARAQSHAESQRQKRARDKKQAGLKSGPARTAAREAASTPVTTGVASNAGIRLNPKR
jgi:hypothetical protein